MKKLLLAIIFIIMLFGCNKKSNEDTLYGVTILSKFHYNGFKKSSVSKNYISYEKNSLEDFDDMIVEVDKKTNRVVDIRVIKRNVYDLYDEGKKTLKKLENKYGRFICERSSAGLMSEIKCISKKSYNNSHFYLILISNPSGIGGFQNGLVEELAHSSYKEE